MKRHSVNLVYLGLVILLSGCFRTAELKPAPLLPTTYAQILQTLTPGTSDPVLEATPEPEIQAQTIWIQPGVPEAFLAELDLSGLTLVETGDEADMKISAMPVTEGVTDGTIWTYALAAPFYTTTDTLALAELKGLWQGQTIDGFSEVVVTESTAAAIQVVLGEPSAGTVKIVDSETLQSQAIGDDPLVTILPFENLTPAWKVLRVDGLSPIDTDFSPEVYALSLSFVLEGEMAHTLVLPEGNYDADKRTVLVMTGVTALTRATAYMMETHGTLSPAPIFRNGWLQPT